MFFRLTVTDVRLLLFPDMTFFGLVYMARGLALQYGDGLSNNEFWRESIYFYNRFGKVCRAAQMDWYQCWFFLPCDHLATSQWKYRIEAAEKIAAVEGVFGGAFAKDSTFNNVVNDKGSRNTNKPGDLKVNITIYSP